MSFPEHWNIWAYGGYSWSRPHIWIYAYNKSKNKIKITKKSWIWKRGQGVPVEEFVKKKDKEEMLQL